MEISPQLTPLPTVTATTNSSQSDTLQTSHKSDTLSKIHLDTYPEHRRKFGSRLVAILPIHTESRGVEMSWDELRGISDWHPAKVKCLIFLENVANTQFPKIPGFNTDPSLKASAKSLGSNTNYWILGFMS